MSLNTQGSYNGKQSSTSAGLGKAKSIPITPMPSFSSKSFPSLPLRSTHTCLPTLGIRPFNIFTDLIIKNANFNQVKIWFSTSSMLIPAALLAILQLVIIFFSIVLWPFGFTLKLAIITYNKVLTLYELYTNQVLIGEKLALTFSIIIMSVIGFFLGIISIPLLLLIFYFNWFAKEPIINGGWSLLLLIVAMIVIGFWKIIVATIVLLFIAIVIMNK